MPWETAGDSSLVALKATWCSELMPCDSSLVVLKAIWCSELMPWETTFSRFEIALCSPLKFSKKPLMVGKKAVTK